MKTSARKALAATTLILACMSGIAASASATVIDDGLYIVDVHQATGEHEPFARYGGCMIVSNGGYDSVPSMYYWPRSTAVFCGLSDNLQDMVAHHRQAVWRIYTVTAGTGMRAYVIKSHFDGRCLIRSQNGTAAAPSLYLWSVAGGDAQYCGFRSADELIANGQAAWDFTGSRFTDGHVMATALWNKRTPVGMLEFVTTIYTGFPNTVDRSTFAGFSADSNPWFFTFWPAGN